ncbi:MAG TPA: maleylpyruvate isomerase N-terminal domain-containing protein [Streptosporangiaceae bacterium]|nr:maleylpyruvate isomerase N-terminal domain-containing protein [Streptosporangiaceae bacterium]
MERADSWDPPGPALPPDPVLRAFEDGVAAISRMAVAFGIPEEWAARTPCPEWRARDLAGHLRCIADDYHEYLDDAPASRYARLLGSGPHPQALARKLARQNAAELAALPDALPDEHLAAFAESARAYARRLPSVWDLPHHQYRDVVVTVAGMAGAATAEWHLHAWDLARALGAEHRPADPEAVLAGWRAGMTHLPATIPGAVPGRPAPRRPAAAGVAGAALPVPVPSYAVPRRAYSADDPWHVLLRASGRRPP